ncbi:MAG TPA: pilus assembly protein TadG-related protein [Hyphomonadaceae bacterium]|nr:pilus assembly protein TadG-related protein [Hyphomonadaceae bacterium]
MKQKLLNRFRLSRGSATFVEADDGGVTVFAVIAFSMLLVIVGLIIDVGRVMNVHSQANSYADRVALAAATELDGRPNALTRAVEAAVGVEAQIDTGFRLTLSGDNAVNVRKLTFMSDLAADPADPYARSPLPGDVITATWENGVLTPATGLTLQVASRETTFILVDVTPETENYIFFPLLAALAPGMDTSATVAPQAVAGFRRSVCNYPPVFMCNIAEASAGVGADFNPVRGQMILAKAGGGGAGWGPGNFGLIDAPDGQGASAVREYMARVNPNTPCTSDVVATKPGASTGPVAQGMNVRMDMYDGPMSGNKGSANYAPAPNVLKGIRAGGNGCATNNNSNTSTPFPRDNCFMPSGSWPNNGIPSGAGIGCTTYNGTARAGDGNWRRGDGITGNGNDGYWETNHPGQQPPPNYASMTRYDVYRYEIETPSLVDTAQEKGRPMCSTASTTTDRALDRRVMSIAVVNCLEAAANGNPIQGQTALAEVAGYLDVFLTEPVGNEGWWCKSTPCNQDLYVEVLGFVRANADQSVLREYPVLYR